MKKEDLAHPTFGETVTITLTTQEAEWLAREALCEARKYLSRAVMPKHGFDGLNFDFQVSLAREWVQLHMRLCGHSHE